MPFAGVIGLNGSDAIASAFLTRHRSYTIPGAGGASEWIRVLGLPRLSFDATKAFSIEYVASGGANKTIAYPPAYAANTVYEIHLPCRWVRFVFAAAAAGAVTVNLRASASS